MARVTVEDCVDKVTNRFELVLLASHRARGMSAGAELLVERDNDKNPVVALREIADKKLVPADIREDLVGSLQKQVDVDEPEEDIIAMPLAAPAPRRRRRRSRRRKCGNGGNDRRRYSRRAAVAGKRRTERPG